MRANGLPIPVWSRVMPAPVSLRINERYMAKRARGGLSRQDYWDSLLMGPGCAPLPRGLMAMPQSEIYEDTLNKYDAPMFSPPPPRSARAPALWFIVGYRQALYLQATSLPPVQQDDDVDGQLCISLNDAMYDLRALPPPEISIEG